MRFPSKRAKYVGLLAGVGVVSVAILLASSGSITVYERTQISSNPSNRDRFEPTSAAGNTWATASIELYPTSNTYVSTWNGGTWNLPTLLNIPAQPTPRPFVDPFLAWDSARQRFVIAIIEPPNVASSGWNVFYGYSNGSSWTVVQTPAMPANSNPRYDYCSIGVDAQGRVIIGAVRLEKNPQSSQFQDAGFWVSVDTTGSGSFSAPVRIGSSGGAQSRIIATNNKFHAFFPTLNESNLPTNVHRYESTNGVNWTGPSLIASFGVSPLVYSPGLYGSGSPIFYAPFLDAKGYTDGAWSVAFPINNNGYNNIFAYTSNRGGTGYGGLVNAAADDEFLHGVSISGDRATWVSDYTYSTLTTRSLPLYMQAIYVPQYGNPVGATLDNNINPVSWGRIPRGGGPLSYVAGDYSGIASNSYAAASVPHVNQSANTNDLFQNFVQEPPGPLQNTNFTPNYIPFPLGVDLTHLARPVQSAVSQRNHRASSSYLRLAEQGKQDPDSDQLAHPSVPIQRLRARGRER